MRPMKYQVWVLSHRVPSVGTVFCLGGVAKKLAPWSTLPTGTFKVGSLGIEFMSTRV